VYDRFPSIASGTADECLAGWNAVGEHLSRRVGSCGVIAIESYPAVNLDEIQDALRQFFPGTRFVCTESFLRPPTEINEMVGPVLGDDPVFGQMNSIEIADFFDPQKLAEAKRSCAAAPGELVIIIGTGASLICPNPSFLVYADLARWEIQMRQRREEVGNLGADNCNDPPYLKYKRAFFVDWRSADRLKVRLFDRIDLLLDTNIPGNPKAIGGDVFRRSLRKAVARPFRVVPFFDPGPWGGHWMERVLGVPVNNAPNHAWCFDCVPEENSLLLGFGEERVEIPALDLVLAHPRELLGESVVARFGAEFPIRFDFLDTVGGGNLSLQVHPLTSYIREHFGMDYTQDESYYMLDAGEGAGVYLGLKENIDRAAMVRDLDRAQNKISSSRRKLTSIVFPRASTIIF